MFEFLFLLFFVGLALWFLVSEEQGSSRRKIPQEGPQIPGDVPPQSSPGEHAERWIDSRRG